MPWPGAPGSHGRVVGNRDGVRKVFGAAASLKQCRQLPACSQQGPQARRVSLQMPRATHHHAPPPSCTEMQCLVHKDSPSPPSQRHQVTSAPKSGHRVPGSSRPNPGRGSYLTTYYGNFQTRVTVQQHRDSRVAVHSPRIASPHPLPAHGNALKPTEAEKGFLPPRPGCGAPEGVSQEGSWAERALRFGRPRASCPRAGSWFLPQLHLSLLSALLFPLTRDKNIITSFLFKKGQITVTCFNYLPSNAG